jgi:hypothetical protein
MGDPNISGNALSYDSFTGYVAPGSDGLLTDSPQVFVSPTVAGLLTAPPIKPVTLGTSAFPTGAYVGAAGVIVLYGTNQYGYQSTDKGATWDTVNFNFSLGSENCVSMTLDRVSNRLIALGTRGSISTFGNSGIPSGGPLYGKFLTSGQGFAPIQSANLGNAKPRLWQPQENLTIKVLR